MTEYNDLTDDEYEALDDELTKNIPKLGLNGTGFITQREMRNLGFTNLSINYLLAKAAKNQKTPAQILDELVCKEMAAVN